MGLGALTALGAAFEGYSKDEDAKAKTASDLQLLYLKAEQDRLAKKEDRAFTAGQNKLNRDLQREIKQQELELAGLKTDRELAEGELSTGIAIGDREIQVPKPSTWRSMSTEKRDIELQRLLSYDLTKDEREQVNQQLSSLDTDPNRKKLGLGKEVFGENYFSEITTGYLKSRTSTYQDPNTGATIKPSSYSWMGNLENYKEEYREYITAIQGRDPSIYRQARKNGTFVINNNGDYSWVTDKDAPTYKGGLDLNTGIQASIGPNLYVNPKRNQPNNFNRFENSSLNEDDIYSRSEVVPALMNSMFKTVSANNLDNVNIIKGVFDANLTSTIEVPTYNPSTGAVELVPVKSGFDAITFRNNIYHANHDSAAETRNNTFTALPEKNYNNGGGKSEESYRAGSDRLTQIEDGRVGLSRYLNIYADLATADGFNKFVGADSFLDPEGIAGGVVALFSNIFGEGGQAQQVLALREANNGLLKTLGTYADKDVVKAVTEANETIFSKTAKASEILNALKVMNGYAAALITQGGKSESARISDKDLQAGIDMTSGSAFAKPRDRMQLAYDFLRRNAVEYASLRAVDTVNGWNYTDTFQTAKRYFSAYYNAQPTYYQNMGDVIEIPTQNPYQYSNFMFLVDDRLAVEARKWENIIYKNEFKDIYKLTNPVKNETNNNKEVNQSDPTFPDPDDFLS
tara:strand:- start:4771 stop:6831 length:2061 start_codon:yes stop_codon:yes gene_type:complete